jgi:hypothetical protein
VLYTWGMFRDSNFKPQLRIGATLVEKVSY